MLPPHSWQVIRVGLIFRASLILCLFSVMSRQRRQVPPKSQHLTIGTPNRQMFPKTKLSLHRRGIGGAFVTCGGNAGTGALPLTTCAGASQSGRFTVLLAYSSLPFNFLPQFPRVSPTMPTSAGSQETHALWWNKSDGQEYSHLSRISVRTLA